MTEPLGRERLLSRAADLATTYLASLPDRPVGARGDAEAIMSTLGRELPEDGQDPVAVIEAMARAVEPGLVASAGPRYFGFVMGGALPASVAADWLAAAWDQNAVLHATSPAAAACEQIAGEWMLDLLGLPGDAAFGLTGGAGLGNVVSLATARHVVLEREGWDVESSGLYGAPEVQVVVGDEAHATLESALQYLGLGRERVVRLPTDGQGRIGDTSLAAHADPHRPTIVCLQAGNVNTGAFDPIARVADEMEGFANGWLHVDGAFGLWAAASPLLRHHLDGVERADSWATDAHKWLNVGYDCGFVATRHPQAQRSAMSTRASYLIHDPERRDGWEWVLDSSRRARGFALYATLRSLGRSGVQGLVERCCALARRMADKLAAAPGVRILNEVALNQVLVRFEPIDFDGDGDECTRDVIRRVQEDGTAWLGGTTWHGTAAMRISVSNWSTTEADADASVEAILRAARATVAHRDGGVA